MKYSDVIQAATDTLQRAFELIVTRFPSADRAEVDRIVKQQFGQINAEGEVLTAEAIFHRYVGVVNADKNTSVPSTMRPDVARNERKGIVNLWARIRSAVRSAQAAIASEPKHLAPLQPMVEDVLTILSKDPSESALTELEYLLSKIQEFVAKWRPSPRPTPGMVYMQPGWARSTDEKAGEALSMLKQLQERGLTDVERQDISTTMKIFVSHSSIDTSAAEALVGCIRSALNIGAKEIRCTSVHGYKLSAGADSNEQLRAEVFECEVFIALLSPSSMQSTYVMFELGARWGAKRYMAPVMIRGTTGSDLKAPLSAIHSVSGSSEADLHELMADLGKRLRLQLEQPAAYLKALRTFSELAVEETKKD